MKARAAIMHTMLLQRAVAVFAATVFATLFASNVNAQVQEFVIEIREHLFYPSELRIPAGQKVKLIIRNLDTTPEEFESYEMNREKVIVGNSQGIVFIGPLKAGEYPFFGEFNIKTAQGKVIVE